MAKQLPQFTAGSDRSWTSASPLTSMALYLSKVHASKRVYETFNVYRIQLNVWVYPSSSATAATFLLLLLLLLHRLFCLSSFFLPFCSFCFSFSSPTPFLSFPPFPLDPSLSYRPLTLSLIFLLFFLLLLFLLALLPSLLCSFSLFSSFSYFWFFFLLALLFSALCLFSFFDSSSFSFCFSFPSPTSFLSSPFLLLFLHLFLLSYRPPLFSISYPS